MAKKDSIKDEKARKNAEAEEVKEEAVVPEKEEEKKTDPIAEAEKKVAEYKDIAQRLQAEFDNYRKRNNDSIRNARFDGGNDILCGLFPIMDTFEKGISLIVDEKAKAGMDLILKQLVALAEKYDVKEIEALGVEFNPDKHHAIAQEEKEEADKNKVIEVYQKGYERKGRVLRPSMVKVGN